jgi:sigma-B regulation protein RsbU (phosphoserine phosphatase)
MTTVRNALELALGKLPEHELNSLTDVVITRHYPSGSIVCYEGEREYIFYIILSGEAAFTKKMGDSEQFLGLKTRGEFFGELGVLDRAPRAATVHAISDCTLIEIHENTLDGILSRHPSVARAIMRGITRSVRDTDRITIAELQLKNNELARTLENLKAAQAELLSRERIKRDIEIAASVHQSILPTTFPQVPGFEFAATARPAREIGGDLYDVVDIGQNQLGIVMADASGKSVQAAIYMAVVKALFLSHSNANLSPTDTVQCIHNMLMKVSPNTTTEMFVTAFYGKLNYTTHQLSFVRAGHDRPIYYHAASQQITLLNPPGRFLGLLPGLIIEEQTLTFAPNDVLVCYSDGVTDAVRANDGKMYGLERLQKIIVQHGQKSAQEITDLIIADIDKFRNRAEQPDDLTLLVTKAIF